jgi:uncharacterized peroxidase-related enzyme
MANIAPMAREDAAAFEPFFKIMDNALGFLPQTHLQMARRPEILKAFAALDLAVFGPGTVAMGLKQLAAFMSSVSGGCRYCQAHSAAAAAEFGTDEAKVAAVFEFETSDLFSDGERAALRLARDAGLVPNATTPEHFEELRKHFNDEQIVELMASISIMGWLNRWNDTMATELEDQPLAFASSKLDGKWEIGKHGK